jgi:TonB family protein
MHRTIKQNDLIKIQIRDITLFVSYSPAPPRIMRRKLWDRDYLFMRMWFSSLALTLALVFMMLAMDSPKPLEVDELPPQITSIIFKPPPPKPIPVPKVVEKKVEQEVKPKPEPKPEPKPMPMPKPPEPKPEPMPVPMPPPEPKPEPMPVPMPPQPKPEPMPVPMMISQPVKDPQPNPTPPKPMATPMTAGAAEKFPRSTPSPMVGDGAPGREGEGARAKGPEGERGRPNAPKADFKQSKGSMNQGAGSAGAVAKGAAGQGNVETLAMDISGSISQALSGGSKGIKAASGKMRGYGGFDTQGGGGLGEIGTGSGGGGQSMDVAGLGTKGLGAGKVGTGRGAIGEGGTLAGGRSRPSIEVGDASETVILGGLDKDVIDKIIRQYFSQIRYCYEKEVSGGSPGIRGRVMTRFVISASGRVSSAAVSSSSLGNDAVQNCLTGVLKRIVFPEPLGGGIVEVSYPFVFSPSTN